MKTIEVKSNQTARTFTIRTYENGRFIEKYRTCKLSKAEFEDMEYFTQEDWAYFLRTSENYYKV